MILEVYKFNQARNGFKLDEKLEYAMLKEEVQEFFEAKTTAERLDAYIDTLYVYEGTNLKYAANFKELPEWLTTIEDAIGIMYKVLIKELGNAKLYEAIIKAKKIVCDANAIKGTKLDVNGKVAKDGFKINPTEQIAKMLEELKNES